MSRLIRAGAVLLGLAVVFAAVPATFGPYLGGNPNEQPYYYAADPVNETSPSEATLGAADRGLAFTVDADAPYELGDWHAPAETPPRLREARNGSVRTTSEGVATDFRAVDRLYVFYEVADAYYAFDVSENGTATTLSASRVSDATVLERGFETRLVEADALRPETRRFVERAREQSGPNGYGYRPDDPPLLDHPFVSLDGTVYYVHEVGHTDVMGLPIVGLVGYGAAILTGLVGLLSLLAALALGVVRRVREN